MPDPSRTSSAAQPMNFDASGVFALFEDNLAQPAHARLLHDLQETVSCSSAGGIDAAFARIETLRRQGLWIAQAANYELGLALETRLQTRLPAGSGPLLRAWAFRRASLLSEDALTAWWDARLAALSPQARGAGVLSLDASLSQTDYEDKVADILRLIDRGDCYQVNFTFPLHGRYFGHPLALFARLRETQPVSYGCLLHVGGDEWMLSRSPELFVSRDGDTLVCRPMKGTVARAPAMTDDEVRRELLTEKNRAENLMIVDLIRNDLGRLTPAGGVQVSSLFEIERYRTVYQLTSTVTAAPVIASLEAEMRALFPCGSVTGAPKIRAMEIIDELEGAARGIYCGALGWLSPDGDHSFSVPIRTLLCSADQHCRLDVGSGIVADSQPAAEYAECITKARFVTALRDDFHLIETMRVEAHDGGIPLLPLHLARLQGSARALGFRFDAEAIHRALDEARHAVGDADHAYRIRLGLHRNGHIEVTTARLDAAPAVAQVICSPWVLDGDDPRLRHKTSARAFYDTALQEALARGCFDVLFFNQRGELCEGARSNVFVKWKGRLLTPAAHCGLLPGVLRARLLAEGRAEEAVLGLEDLENAEELWIGNALRGLLPARLVTA